MKQIHSLLKLMESAKALVSGGFVVIKKLHLKRMISNSLTL